MRLWLSALFVLVSVTTADACRLALALALDVSGSVDEVEYRMQMDGLAEALTDPDVKDALLSVPGAPVSIAVFEWSASGYQRLIQDWVSIAGDAALMDLAGRLRRVQRAPAPEATGLGAAMRYGKGLLDQRPECWKATLDVSGDGKNNDWPAPRALRRAGALAGIAINGLVISEEADPEAPDGLAAYFRAEVIQGPDAFVEVARGFSDYERAMRQKLLREVTSQPVGLLGTGGDFSLAGR